MRRLALACCLAAACSSPGGGPSSEVPPAPRTIRYVPDSVTYHLASHRQLEQEFQGQANRQDLQLQAWIRSVLAAGAADTMPARLVLDSVAESGGGSAPGDLTAIRGATWTGRLTPSGEILEMTGPRDAGLTNQMFNTLREFYPRLPAAGVTAGDAWVDTVTSDVDVGGVQLTIRAVHHHDAIGLQPWGAGEAFLIRVTTAYTIAGEGSQSGQPLTLDGTGRRHTQEYLSPTGRYLGNIVADTSTYEVVLTALGMSIPGQQWRYDTLRVAR